MLAAPQPGDIFSSAEDGLDGVVGGPYGSFKVFSWLLEAAD